MGFGAAIQILGDVSAFLRDRDFFLHIGALGTSTVRLGAPGTTNVLPTGGATILAAPTVSPAYIGVGYIIGPRLASLNFAGGVFAWGFDGAACSCISWAAAQCVHSRGNRGGGCMDDANANIVGDSSSGRSPLAVCLSARVHVVPHAQQPVRPG
jgi:hypothetical protein